MFDRAPNRMISRTTFRDESMDMRIPFQVSAKGMQDADKTGSKIFGLIEFIKHAKDYIPNRGKKTVQKRAVF